MAKPFTTGTALTAYLLIAGLGAGLLGAPGAHAAFMGCRSDPIVILSNGVVLDLSAYIADDVSDVQSISYTLHAPQGVSVLRAISTDGAVGYREKFRFESDGEISGAAGVYTVEVKVQTRSENISVTATIAGGDAATLGITPEMVSLGATTFTPVDANDARKPGPKGSDGQGPKGPDGQGPKGTKGTKGPNAPAVLPATVTSALNAWAQSAPWAVTASATSTGDEELKAVISL